MKKYIRTKNGVFERDKCKTTLWVMHIIKEADTIKELCDDFVVSKKDKKPHIADVPYYKIQMDKEYIEKNGYEIYGAIWTDKGLMYVAKMNQDGVLELL